MGYPSEIKNFIETQLKPAGFNPLSYSSQAFDNSRSGPDSELLRMMQHFFDETPDMHCSDKGIDSVFRFLKMLTDNEAAPETMLSMLRKLRANSTDQTKWLHPEVLSSLMNTAEYLFDPLDSEERTPGTLLNLIETLTAKRYSRAEIEAREIAHLESLIG
jgi:hypothetical protein